MPDDRFTGPGTDDLWPGTDESQTDDAWPVDPDPPATNDSWASDLWATANDTSDDDAWSPPSASADPDTSSETLGASDLWGSTSDPSTATWMSDARSEGDTGAVESAAEAPWVSDVWASTEPSPWVSDLWASTDPSPATDTDSWSIDETTGFTDVAPMMADDSSVVDAPDAPAVSVTEPFWRSESWLLEPLGDDTQSVEVAGEGDEEPAAPWSGESTDSPPIMWDSAAVVTDEPTDEPEAEATPESLGWGELGDDSAGSWTSYQRALDESAVSARPEARPPVTPAPTTNASDFAQQRASGPPPPPTKGFPAFMYKASAGHIRMKPRRDEQITRDAIADIRRNIAGLRQITFTNPKGGSGKTTAALLTSMTMGQLRGGYILAWDNNETQGTLGVRARRDDHANTVRDLIADLPAFSGPVAGRVGDLAKYVRSQGDAMFDVLASDEQAEAGEMMTAAAFQAVREVVGRFYKILCVDTGNNVRAANWAASIDSTDQLVVTASVRWESAYSASRMLDYLEQAGRGDLVSNAVTVLVMPQSMKGLNVSQVETHFSVRTREVLRVPFDTQLDNGDEIPFESLNPATRLAWLQIGAAITRGL